VLVQPAYRGIFQRAFFGRPQDRLSVLCEDAVAEALIPGVLDRINPLLQLTPDNITVGRDTGKDQFAQHADALGKFKLLDEFAFVLDGDAKDAEKGMAAAAVKDNRIVRPLHLPGNGPPEDWVYSVLEAKSAVCAAELGCQAWALCCSSCANSSTTQPTAPPTSPKPASGCGEAGPGVRLRPGRQRAAVRRHRVEAVMAPLSCGTTIRYSLNCRAIQARWAQQRIWA